MRIAIDIDSTLHHYWDQLTAVALRRYGVELSYDDQHTWGITTLPQEHVRECVVETHSPELIAVAVPYAGAVEAVAGWHAAGHFIHITSHRAVTSHDATAAWLEAIGLPFDELYCSYDKISRCREIGIDLLIDDSPVNLRDALDAGMLAATIEHPWNRELCAESGVVCGVDWPGLAALLEPVLAHSR